MTPAASSATLTGGLCAEGVSFGYGDEILFADISFTIPPGAVYGLVGRSGVGKTTLLNILLGLFRARDGRVLAGGLPVLDPGHIRGAVFREDSLLGWLSVEDNVLFPEHERPSPERRERGRRLLIQAGLEGAEALLPKALSAGMAKRVELVRAWLSDELYFVGDEPFAALDSYTRSALHALWRELRREHPRTGVLCTHDVREAASLCDAVLVMHGTAGRVRVTELKTSDAVSGQAADPRLGDRVLRQIDDLLS